MARIVKEPKPEKGDVVENAEERLDHVMEEYDTVLVGFSGGKDSGTLMHLALEAHERAGRDDRIHAVHIDDEVIPPETEEYVKKVAQNPRVKMWWCCLPCGYYNGTSSTSQEWYVWNPEEEDKWVRDMPREFCEETDGCELVTLDHPRVSDPTPGGNTFEMGETRHVDLNRMMFDRWNRSEESEIDYGHIGNAVGVRTTESLTRLRGVLKGGWVNEKTPKMDFVKPIYDMRDHDLWKLHEERGWDYNGAYDKLAAAGVSRGDWRTAQPYGPEPLRGLGHFKRCWPDVWDKAMHRVPGATAAHEWGIELYKARLREGETWQDAAVRYWRSIPDPDHREEMAGKIRGVLERHDEHSTQPLQMEERCPHCTWSWQRIAKTNARGVRKWRKGDA